MTLFTFFGLFCILFISTVVSNYENVLDVAAFNVQVFGVHKMNKPLLHKYLPKIVARYDLILIQEIRDSSGEAIQELMKLVQQIDSRYKLELSERLGRSTSKEQYGYIYRSDWLSVVNSYVYADSNDHFERPPFVVHFKSSKAEVKNFVTIGIHTKPDDAENEISRLVDVYDDAVNKWSVQNAILMGDFNAGCNYVKSYDNIALATDKRFYWMIGNRADSTTKDTDCPYDRIVLAGSQLLNVVVMNSPRVYDFATAYGLTEDEAKIISDHFPVQIELQSEYGHDYIVQKKELELTDKLLNTGLTTTKVYNMRSNAIKMGYNVVSEYTKSGAYLEIHVSDVASSRTKALELLAKMHTDLTGFISRYEFDSVASWLVDRYQYLPRGNGDFQTLFDWLKNKERLYSINLTCSLADRSNLKCFVRVEEIDN